MLTRLFRAALDLLLPPRCVGTGEIVDAQGMIAPAFWAQLQFIEAPFCKTCGLPFAFDMADGSLCAACLEREPLFTQARAAVVYNDASRQLVLDFKYGDRLHAVHTFVPWILRAGAGLITQTDIIVPVPLHTKRLRERRFNQSAILAQEIAKRTNKLCLPDALHRTRATLPQKGLSHAMRDKNVRGAFAAKPRQAGKIEGARILLIDDVYTTGATLNACAKALLDADAKEVNVLTIARVTREEY